MSDPKPINNSSKDGDDELTFVVTTNPYDRKSAANKKRVRSVAALKSWPERRKKTFERYDQSGHTGGFVLDLPDPSTAAAGPSKRASGVPPKQQKTKESIVPLSQQQPSSTSTILEQQVDEEPLFEKCTRSIDEDCLCIHCRSERRYRYGPSQGQVTKHVAFPHSSAPAPQGKKRTADGQVKPRVFEGDLAMLTPPTSPSPSPLVVVNNVARQEPFNCYPVPYRPWFDKILYHSTFPTPARYLPPCNQANHIQC